MKYEPHLMFYTSIHLVEAFIFGGAYLRREICVSKSIGPALQLKVNLSFCFVLVCIWGQFSNYKPPAGGLYLEGLIFGIIL